MSNTIFAEPQTQNVLKGPPNFPPTDFMVSGSEFPDDIRDLGDRIAKLTNLQSIELSNYMKERHGWDVQSA